MQVHTIPYHSHQNVHRNKQGMDMNDVIILIHVELFWVDTQAKGELHPKKRGRRVWTITNSNKWKNNCSILLSQFDYMIIKQKMFDKFQNLNRLDKWPSYVEVVYNKPYPIFATWLVCYQLWSSGHQIQHRWSSHGQVESACPWIEVEDRTFQLLQKPKLKN